jgi:hypothetical protein
MARRGFTARMFAELNSSMAIFECLFPIGVQEIEEVEIPNSSRIYPNHDLQVRKVRKTMLGMAL